MVKGFAVLNVRNASVLALALAMLAGVSWWLIAQDGLPAGFRAYPLKHLQAAEVQQQLQAVLTENNVQYEVVVDRQGNRLLIRGAEETQRLAAQLLSSLDRPAAATKTLSDNAVAPVVRGYRVPSGSLDANAKRLRAEFPPSAGVRIATDQRTNQLIVVASEDIHRRVAQALQGVVQADAPAAAEAAGNTQNQAGYALKNISWRELEDSLTKIWGTRLSVATERNGEVVTVHMPGPNGPTAVLQIDRPQGLIKFPGTPASALAWQRVVLTLDQPRNSDQNAADMVLLDRADPTRVQRAVALLASTQQSVAGGEAAPAERRGSRPEDIVSMVFQAKPEAGPGAPATTPVPAGKPAQPKPGEASGVKPAAKQPGTERDVSLDKDDDGGLLGPVQVEYMEGLDVIVLRGHRRDVERVRRIIGDIERLSADTQPDIEVVQLKHVGCQALETLIMNLYTEILSNRQGQVAIRALVKPNAMLLIGRTDSMKIIKDLITKVDVDVEADTEFEVFMLKNISAGDAETTIRNFFVDRLGQAALGASIGGLTAQTSGQARPALGARVNVLADFRTNSLIVQAPPRDLAEVRRLVTQIDVKKGDSKLDLKIFRLKNALASDVAPVLQDALNWQLSGNRTPVGATATGTFGGGGFGGLGGGLGAQQQQDRVRMRAAALSFTTIDAEGKKVMESGMLLDVRVTADVNGNSLVVAAPAESMELIGALVKELDKLPNAQAQIKVFTIVNGDATSLSNMLRQLLGQTTQTGTTGGVGGAGGLFGQGAINPFLQPSLQSAASIGESSLVPVRFGVDQRTNSIIASGSEGDLGVVEAILLRLDEDSFHKHKTTVFWLANSSATTVQTAVQTWLTNRTTQYTNQMSLSPENPEVRYAQQTIVVAESVSNSVIVSAVPSLFEEIKRVIEALDRRPPMIKIDVLIAEVTLSDAFEFGTEYGLQDSLLFNRQVFGTSPARGVGFNFNNQALGDTSTTGNKNSLGGQGLTNFGLGRVSTTQGYGGLVLSASSDSISVLLRALQQKGRVQVLSRPTVTTLDSQPASVNVGARVARLQGSTVGTGGTVTQNVSDVQTGLVLGVTPRVTPDGLVVMEIDAEKSALDPNNGVPIPTSNGSTVIQPNINSTTASTTISARSGQTVVFAGLIQSSKVSQRRGIPWLSELPLMGPLFRFDTESSERKELLIVMTPHVVRGEEDTDSIKRAESERISWCLTDVADLWDVSGMTARPGDWCTHRKPCHICGHGTVIYPDTNPSGMDEVMLPRLEEPQLPGRPPQQTSRLRTSAQPTAQESGEPTLAPVQPQAANQRGAAPRQFAGRAAESAGPRIVDASSRANSGYAGTQTGYAEPQPPMPAMQAVYRDAASPAAGPVPREQAPGGEYQSYPNP